MDHISFRAALAAIGWGLSDLARILGIDGRLVRCWSSGKNQPDLLSFMSPEALVCMLPFLRSACEEHTDDGFDLFMALEFMFATARLKDPEMSEHFLEINRLLAPAEKIETLAFSCRYASSSPHLAPGHEVPSITRRGMIRFDQVS